jgi:hypothetical protein
MLACLLTPLHGLPFAALVAIQWDPQCITDEAMATRNLIAGAVGSHLLVKRINAKRAALVAKYNTTCTGAHAREGQTVAFLLAQEEGDLPALAADLIAGDLLDQIALGPLEDPPPARSRKAKSEPPADAGDLSSTDPTTPPPLA